MALWTLRALSAGGFGVLGWRLGLLISELSFDTQQFIPWGLAFTLAGVVLGAAAAPYIILKPWRASVGYISALPGPSLAAAIVGLLLGLIVASLVVYPAVYHRRLAGLGRAHPDQRCPGRNRPLAGNAATVGHESRFPGSGTPCQLGQPSSLHQERQHPGGHQRHNRRPHRRRQHHRLPGGLPVGAPVRLGRVAPYSRLQRPSPPQPRPPGPGGAGASAERRHRAPPGARRGCRWRGGGRPAGAVGPLHAVVPFLQRTTI